MDENNALDNAVAPARKIGFNGEFLFFIPIVVSLLLLCGGISAGLASVMSWWLAVPLGILLGMVVFAVWNAGNGTTLMEMGCGSTILLVLLVILLPVFQQARNKARQVNCVSNLKHIAAAMRLYADDHEGLLPVSEGWQAAITPYLGKNEKGRQIGAEVFHCPTQSQSATISYGFAPLLAGEKLSSLRHQDTLPLVYESEDEKTLLGSGRHKGRTTTGSNIAFVDGHVKWTQDSKSSPRKETPL